MSFISALPFSPPISAGNPLMLSEYDYASDRDCYVGYCRTCRAGHDEIEPDISDGLCEDCDEAKVTGVEELLLMGLLEVMPSQSVARSFSLSL